MKTLVYITIVYPSKLNVKNSSSKVTSHGYLGESHTSLYYKQIYGGTAARALAVALTVARYSFQIF